MVGYEVLIFYGREQHKQWMLPPTVPERFLERIAGPVRPAREVFDIIDRHIDPLHKDIFRFYREKDNMTHLAKAHSYGFGLQEDILNVSGFMSRYRKDAGQIQAMEERNESNLEGYILDESRALREITEHPEQFQDVIWKNFFHHLQYLDAREPFDDNELLTVQRYQDDAKIPEYDQDTRSPKTGVSSRIRFRSLRRPPN